jgi:hypothetical protein
MTREKENRGEEGRRARIERPQAATTGASTSNQLADCQAGISTITSLPVAIQMV